MDSIVGELRNADLDVYGLITYSPKWAVPPTLARTARIDSHRPVVNHSVELGNILFAKYAAAVVRRYGSRILRWEIWNEENHPEFWFATNPVGTFNNGPGPQDYAGLYSLAKDSMLAANPQVVIAIGGLASFGGRRFSVADPLDKSHVFEALPPHEYLRELLRNGVRPMAVALHPYSVIPPGRKRSGESVAVFPDLVLDSTIAVLDGSGLSRTPIWITEWGVDAKLVRSQRELDDWVEAGLDELLCNPRIGFVTIYALTDDNPKTAFGLFTDDGSLSPMGRAFDKARARRISCS
jgi:hypothetical protein